MKTTELRTIVGDNITGNFSVIQKCQKALKVNWLGQLWLKNQFQTSWNTNIFFTDICRSLHGVWKSLLDESEKKAKQHLAISEELQGQMGESMKTLKSNKTQVFKKVSRTAMFSYINTKNDVVHCRLISWDV